MGPKLRLIIVLIYLFVIHLNCWFLFLSCSTFAILIDCHFISYKIYWTLGISYKALFCIDLFLLLFLSNVCSMLTLFQHLHTHTHKRKQIIHILKVFDAAIAATAHVVAVVVVTVAIVDYYVYIYNMYHPLSNAYCMIIP